MFSKILKWAFNAPKLLSILVLALAVSFVGYPDLEAAEPVSSNATRAQSRSGGRSIPPNRASTRRSRDRNPGNHRRPEKHQPSSKDRYAPNGRLWSNVNPQTAPPYIVDEMSRKYGSDRKGGGKHSHGYYGDRYGYGYGTPGFVTSDGVKFADGSFYPSEGYLERTEELEREQEAEWARYLDELARANDIEEEKLRRDAEAEAAEPAPNPYAHIPLATIEAPRPKMDMPIVRRVEKVAVNDPASTETERTVVRTYYGDAALRIQQGLPPYEANQGERDNGMDVPPTQSLTNSEVAPIQP